MKSESITVLIETFVIRAAHPGVPFEDRDNSGMVVVGESRGELACFLDAERAVRVREIQYPNPLVVATLGSVADGHSPTNPDRRLLRLSIGAQHAGAIRDGVGFDVFEALLPTGMNLRRRRTRWPIHAAGSDRLLLRRRQGLELRSEMLSLRSGAATTRFPVSLTLHSGTGDGQFDEIPRMPAPRKFLHVDGRIRVKTSCRTNVVSDPKTPEFLTLS